jgi:hypothetical protein
MAFKSRLYSLLVLGVVASIAFNFEIYISKSNGMPFMKFNIPGNDLYIVLVCGCILIFLVFFNLIRYKRKKDFQKELLDFARDPNISEEFKYVIINEIHSRNIE